jgi:hypothetical protein
MEKGRAKPRARNGLVGEMKLGQVLLLLRQNGVDEFTCPQFSVKFGSRAALQEPLVNNAPDGIKFEPTKDIPGTDVPIDDELLFYSAEQNANMV